MKNFIFLFLAIGLFTGLQGCKDKTEPSGGVDLKATFMATYNGTQLEKNKDYTFGTFPLLFLRYRMYLSDITLIKEDDTEVKISDVEYLDFTPDSSPSDLSVTPEITYKNVPEGNYKGIRMGIGVNAANNAKKPSDFPADSPLSIETDYWPGWASYIFMIIDGKADPDNDGTKNLSFSYHCGSDMVYQEFTINQAINVTSSGANLNIEFDLLKLLTQEDGSLYDMANYPVTSNDVNNFKVALEVISGVERAITIDQ
ncbi:MAG: MbnP family protein [Saprospiraceae bacterium]|nr:hypothetical protein [Saprospiraceae bacterium]MCB9343871.1 hypothetical protein [Lewinellaceae bacterium]